MDLTEQAIVACVLKELEQSEVREVIHACERFPGRMAALMNLDVGKVLGGDREVALWMLRTARRAVSVGVA